MPPRRQNITIRQRLIRYLLRQVANQQVRRIAIIFIAVLIETYLLIKLDPLFNKFIFTKISLCNLGLFISALILALLAIIDDFSDFLRLEFWKSTLLKIALILLACYLAYECSQIKDSLNEQLLTKQKNTADSLQIARDNKYNDALKARTNEVRRDITNTFITALAANGKEYIAGQKKVIDMVRDSARRVKVEQKVSPPEVYLDSLKVHSYPNLMKRFNFAFKNQKDAAYRMRAKLFTLVVINETGLFEKSNSTGQNITINQISNVKGFDLTLDYLPKSPIRTYYFFIDGGYYDKDEKYYPFSDLSMVDGTTFRVNDPQGDKREGIMGLFKKFYPEIK